MLMGDLKNPIMFTFNDVLKGRGDLPAEMVKDLEEYYDSMKLLSDGDGKNLEFSNKDFLHAGMVLATLFNRSKTDINIFAHSFSGQVSNPQFYREELSEAIKRGVEVNVVFEQLPTASSECYRDLKALQTTHSSLKLFVLNSSFVTKVNAKGLNNFTTGDSRMFRYETDKVNFKAYCNFDDLKTVSALNNNFKVLKVNSNPC